MNKYTCPECGNVVVVRSNAAELQNYKDTCGQTVTMKLGVVDVAKPTAKANVVPAPVVQLKAAPLPERPQQFNPSQSSNIPKQELVQGQVGSTPIIPGTLNATLYPAK